MLYLAHVECYIWHMLEVLHLAHVGNATFGTCRECCSSHMWGMLHLAHVGNATLVTCRECYTWYMWGVLQHMSGMLHLAHVFYILRMLESQIRFHRRSVPEAGVPRFACEVIIFFFAYAPWGR